MQSVRAASLAEKRWRPGDHLRKSEQGKVTECLSAEVKNCFQTVVFQTWSEHRTMGMNSDKV